MSRRRKGKQMGGERPSPDHVPFAPDPPFWQRISTTGWLLLGLALGLVGSLYYAWVIDPVIFTDASPARFNDRYRAEYIVLVSQSYTVNGDWSLVQSRLAALEDPNVSQTVNALLEQYVREQRPAPLLRNLAIVAQGLGAQGQAIALFAPTPLPDNLAPTPTPAIVVTPAATPTITPTPTETPIASTTPTATSPATTTPQPNFRLLNQERVCDPEGDAPRIEVITVDAFLNDLPGVEVLVTWQGGNDRFFTGFKPAQGEGYGDFTMSPDASYSVRLADSSPEVSGLRLEPCESGFDGGWRLTFQNLRFGATATPESRE